MNEDILKVYAEDIKEKSLAGSGRKGLNRRGRGPVQTPADFLRGKARRRYTCAGEIRRFTVLAKERLVEHIRCSRLADELASVIQMALIEQGHSSTVEVKERFQALESSVKELETRVQSLFATVDDIVQRLASPILPPRTLECNDGRATAVDVPGKRGEPRRQARRVTNEAPADILTERRAKFATTLRILMEHGFSLDRAGDLKHVQAPPSLLEAIRSGTAYSPATLVSLYSRRVDRGGLGYHSWPEAIRDCMRLNSRDASPEQGNVECPAATLGSEAGS